MKFLAPAAVIGLALFAAPLSAQAQVAAGALPNSFDSPARPATAPQAAPAVPVVTTPANPQSEDTLRTIIAGAQAGSIDYSLMTDGLGERVRRQEAQLAPVIRGFGAVQAVDFVGSQNGADLFVITFANATTQWVIGFEGDKVAALLFRPAE